MTGQRLGLLSLRIDAIYCVVLGLAIAVTAGLWHRTVALPVPVLIGTGVAVIAWAGLVEWMRVALPLQSALRIVMIANVAATLAVAAASLTGAALAAVLVILSIAVDSALFAGSQGLALAGLRRAI